MTIPLFKTNNPKTNVNGTSLQGYVSTTFDKLKELLGPAGEGSADGKTNVEWTLEFVDGTVATIYDWKMSNIPTETYDWHIGGKSKKAVEYIQEALKLETKLSLI
jgi:hypothetical protein